MKAKFFLHPVARNCGLISAVLIAATLFFGLGMVISLLVNTLLMRHFPFPTPDQLDSMFSPKPGFNFRLAGARPFLSPAMPEPRSGAENVSPIRVGAKSS